MGTFLSWQEMGVSEPPRDVPMIYKKRKIRGLNSILCKVSANPWQDENNGTPRYHGAKSD
jgi:hypothetical protein